MINNMFLVENNVPDVYVNESRDFQLIGRLYDLVFQSTRFSIDSMDYISDTKNCNNNILPLLATKVGFFTDRELSDETLRKVISAFPFIIKYKGCMKGFQLVLNLFERITNIHVELQKTADPNIVNITFYDYISDVELLYELIEYVRPVGLLVNVQLKVYVNSLSQYVVTDTVNITEAMNYVNLSEEELNGVVVQNKSVNSKNSDIASNVGYTLTVKNEHTEDKEISSDV